MFGWAVVLALWTVVLALWAVVLALSAVYPLLWPVVPVLRPVVPSLWAAMVHAPFGMYLPLHIVGLGGAEMVHL